MARFHRITLTEILRDLAPLNEGRDKRDRITYDSLWVHAKRHYDLAGIAAYRSTRMSVRSSRRLCGDDGCRDAYRIARETARIKYEES